MGLFFLNFKINQILLLDITIVLLKSKWIKQNMSSPFTVLPLLPTPHFTEDVHLGVSTKVLNLFQKVMILVTYEHGVTIQVSIIVHTIVPSLGV